LTPPPRASTIPVVAHPTDRRQDETPFAGGWNEVLERDATRAETAAGRALDEAEEAAWGIRTDRAAFGRDYDGSSLPAAKAQTPHA
jgi:hypothetical protein